MTPLTTQQIARLADVCRRWGIVELSVFGSLVRSEHTPESDADVLARFRSGVSYDLDDFESMTSDLSEIFGRKVDLVPDHAVRNPYIRREIEATRQVLYAA